VYVEDAARKAGLGSHMLAEGIAWVKEQMLESLIVWPSETSTRYYERHKFVRSTEANELDLLDG
jgi:predicted GNAT family N-acyltransferase